MALTEIMVGRFDANCRYTMTRRLAHDIQVTERDVQWRHLVGDQDTKLSKNSKAGYWV